MNDYSLGETIQNHVRRKWHFREHWTVDEADRVELPKEFLERIYVLGVDDRLLLEVDPAQVLDRLDEIEAEAMFEDRGFGAG